MHLVKYNEIKKNISNTAPESVLQHTILSKVGISSQESISPTTAFLEYVQTDTSTKLESEKDKKISKEETIRKLLGQSDSPEVSLGTITLVYLLDLIDFDLRSPYHLPLQNCHYRYAVV